MEWYYLTLRSGNRKTGPIPVGTSHKGTCPSTCPLAQAGCYAESGRLGMFWSRVSRGDIGVTWRDFLSLVRAIRPGSLWRHNQAGDLPGKGTRIDAGKLLSLAQASAHARGFTYTHYPLTGENGEHNGEAILSALRLGFTVNLSADSLAQADALKRSGLPVVVTLPSSVNGAETPTLRTLEGNTVTVCPATYLADGAGSTCAECELCFRAGRRSIVGFPAHGNGKGIVDRRLAGD